MSEITKVVSEIKNSAGTMCTPLRTDKQRGVTYSRQWGHRVVFRKMELFEFEKEEENNAPSILMMVIIMIILIYFVRIMKKIIPLDLNPVAHNKLNN